MRVLHDLNKQGKTVIIVTHDEEIVAQEQNILYLKHYIDLRVKSSEI